jgi:basic membrane lipoprotein Med (substrate-binding protein (PBP1-ABC) superfamily)
MQNGGLSIVYNPGYALPAEVKAAADKAIEEIKSGAITVTP